MPYVFVEELAEGQVEADVFDASAYNELQTSLEGMTAERDELQRNYDEAIGARDNLERELGEAKTKFANAFLSSPQKAKDTAAVDAKKQEKPMTFATLFAGRNTRNGD